MTRVRSIACLLAGLILTAPVGAGGVFRLELGPAVAANAPNVKKNTAFVVRSVACPDRAPMTMTAVAESVENGARQTVKLELVPLTASGAYAVPSAWRGAIGVVSLAATCGAEYRRRCGSARSERVQPGDGEAARPRAVTGGCRRGVRRARSTGDAMSPGVLRSSAWDAPLVVLTLVYGAALVVAPSIPLIAVGSWWTANTIAHNFIHRPFFTSSSLNRLFSLLLTAIAGVPQIVWQQRHLAHHAGRRWRPQWSGPLAGELVIVGLLWTTLVLAVPGFFITVYAPGCLVGLLLCAIQGHYEHARGTTSHYGRLYNLLCCNDGYHAEHHARPGVHWTLLPELVEPGARSSRWPSLLRWLDGSALELLERLVLRSRTLQNFVLRCHRRACRRLLSQIPPAARVAIVGGGLFPRTALILRELLPAARLVIIDAEAEHLETARAMLADGDRKASGYRAVSSSSIAAIAPPVSRRSSIWWSSRCRFRASGRPCTASRPLARCSSTTGCGGGAARAVSCPRCC